MSGEFASGGERGTATCDLPLVTKFFMFITFEGPEGSGKTTQIKLLADFLSQQGYPVCLTREPGGTTIGNQIRACLHDVSNVAMLSTTEILLYSASRAQLVGEVIRPELAAGRIVLCDRYADSTLAYQGYGRGLSLAALHQITNFATDGLKPDLTFYLEVAVLAGLNRRASNALEMNRMDLQAIEFYERVTAGYETLMAEEPARWVRVDGSRPVMVVQEELRRIVSGRIHPKNKQDED